MKRMWIVYVEQGVGSELNNTLDAAEFFGPYTERQAYRLRNLLNRLFDDVFEGESEGMVASVMCTESLKPTAVLDHYIEALGNKGDAADTLSSREPRLYNPESGASRE